MAYDLKKEEEVKEFLEKIGMEYRFGCFSEKNPASCHLLGDYFEGVKRDFEKAAKVYRANCDDSAHPRSCYKYANYRFMGRGLKKDLKDAFYYYKKGCNAGEARACVNGGLMCVAQSKAVKDMPKDYVTGLELLNKGCDKDNAFSCHYIAGMYIGGVEEHIQKDMKKAYNYALRGCELGNMYACVNVSMMYRKGDGVKEDLKKSEEFMNKVLEMQKNEKEAAHVPFQQGV